jgi:hypothetical protein
MNISTRAQFLINSLISNSAATTSEYPMRAIRAKNKLDEYATELREYISKLENPGGPVKPAE